MKSSYTLMALLLPQPGAVLCQKVSPKPIVPPLEKEVPGETSSHLKVVGFLVEAPILILLHGDHGNLIMMEAPLPFSNNQHSNLSRQHFHLQAQSIFPTSDFVNLQSQISDAF